MFEDTAVKKVNSAIDHARRELSQYIRFPNLVVTRFESGIKIILPKIADCLTTLTSQQELCLTIVDQIASALTNKDEIFVEEPNVTITPIQKYWEDKIKQVIDNIRNDVLWGLLNNDVQRQLKISRLKLDQFLLSPEPALVTIDYKKFSVAFGSKEKEPVTIWILYESPESELPQGLIGFKTEKDALAHLEKHKDHYQAKKGEILEAKNLFLPPQEVIDEFQSKVNAPELKDLPKLLAETLFRIFRYGSGAVNITLIDDLNNHTDSSDSARELLKRLKKVSALENFEDAWLMIVSRHLAAVAIARGKNEGFEPTLAKAIKILNFSSVKLTRDEELTLEAIDKLCYELIKPHLQENTLSKAERVYFASCDPFEDFIEKAIEKKMYDEIVSKLEVLGEFFELDENSSAELLEFLIRNKLLEKPTSRLAVDQAMYVLSHLVAESSNDDVKRAVKALKKEFTPDIEKVLKDLASTIRDVLEG